MDSNVQRLLSDKIYERRKAGALELENLIRKALADDDPDRISRILRQLVHDYAYAVHQPHARNGGLIGLAAAAIALGSHVSPYLSLIVPPVLACFTDQDARVRYYACESMYNIAKVAKGEILVYFNSVFDALCKLSADTELSVKNGAELLDRLVKDIVSESAATYASIVIPQDQTHGYGDDAEEALTGENGERLPAEGQQKAFSLPRFIPLLKERIHVLNPFTRTFLVGWITLLDSIPDLELVTYLPSFLGGLLKFLSDPNQDVQTTTKVALNRLLAEIKKIAAVKKQIAEGKRGREDSINASAESLPVAVDSPTNEQETNEGLSGESQIETEHLPRLDQMNTNVEDSAVTDGASSVTAAEDGEADADDEDEDDASNNDSGIDERDFESEWIPGQDVVINYQEILDILLNFLASSSASSGQESIQLTTLKWIEVFLEICPDDVLAFTPRLLAQVLPALSSVVENVKDAAGRVNERLMALVIALPEEPPRSTESTSQFVNNGLAAASNGAFVTSGNSAAKAPKDALVGEEMVNSTSLPSKQLPLRKPSISERAPSPSEASASKMSEPPSKAVNGSVQVDSLHTDIDYEAATNALTKQFLHEAEATRVAALAWLIMLHRKSPRRILAIQDATFPALLKTLSDPAEAVVTRDLLLLSQISKSSDDSYFTSFMVSLLKLFSQDRYLLEVRGSLIIRQLCISLSAEKIYRTMADCLEREEHGDDIEFAAIMVQMLNNNLLTAPELADLRKRLRNLETREGQTFFTVLFRAWSVNGVATISLCLLAQTYEQAYHLLQVFADLEMTVNMLIQLDKLIQLLESPVFTYIRMQLVEPERNPYLYKCLYGLLMLLPQSSAFAALKNRLLSVSPISYLHPAPRPAPSASSGATPSSVSSYERQNRLKSRDDGFIRWTELLDKFKAVQERVRRHQHREMVREAGLDQEDVDVDNQRNKSNDFALMPPPSTVPTRPESAQSLASAPSASVQQVRDSRAKEQTSTPVNAKHKSGLSQLSRLATGRKKDKEKEKK